jgi:hypothetical protein
MVKVQDLMTKSGSGNTLGWFEYLVVLVNDEKGAGRHIQRLFFLAIFLSLLLQIMMDMAHFTPKGEDSVACEFTIRPSCQALKWHVSHMQNIVAPIQGFTLETMPVVDVPLGCLVHSRVEEMIAPTSVNMDGSSIYNFTGNVVVEMDIFVAHFYWTLNASKRGDMLALFLEYECDKNTCFGMGANFGSIASAYSCSQCPHILPDDHCVHPTCAQGDDLLLDLSPTYFYLDLLVTVIFTIELAMAYVFNHSTAISFFSSKWTWIDLIATVPSIVTISLAIATGTTSVYHVQQYFGASNLGRFFQSGVFAVFRFFKIFKHIPQVVVLQNTFLKVADQLILVYAFMFLFVIVFAMMLYYLESGRECFFDVNNQIATDEKYNTGKYTSVYSGDQIACTAEDEVMLLQSYESGILVALPIYGERFQIDINGDISQFPDIYQCMWFFVVTVTSVGYGDISPVTTAGKALTVIGMLFGAVYLAMPLSLVGGEYFSLWKEYAKRIREAKEAGNENIAKLELSEKESHAFTIWCNSLVHFDRTEELLVSSNNGPKSDTFLNRVSKVMAEQHKIMDPYYRLNKVILAIKCEGNRQQEEKDRLEQ